MNPLNKQLHAFYQAAKWRIQNEFNGYVCCALEDAWVMNQNKFKKWLWKVADIEFQRHFKHLAIPGCVCQAFWPGGDIQSRMAALDTMISLCKKNYF